MNRTFFSNPTQFNSSADPMAETGTPGFKNALRA